MQRRHWIELIPVRRIEEKGVVSFNARCPIQECTHDDESVVHYGQEEEAKKSAVGKILSHLSRDHKFPVDEDIKA